MLDRLFQPPCALARQRAGPLLEERLRYLDHLAAQGMARATLRAAAVWLLTAVEVLRLAARPGEVLFLSEIRIQAASAADRRTPPAARPTSAANSISFGTPASSSSFWPLATAPLGTSALCRSGRCLCRLHGPRTGAVAADYRDPLLCAGAVPRPTPCPQSLPGRARAYPHRRGAASARLHGRLPRGRLPTWPAPCGFSSVTPRDAAGAARALPRG